MTSLRPPMAYFDGTLATDLVQIADIGADQDILDHGGWWALWADFEGSITGYQFASLQRAPLPPPSRPWPGTATPWASTFDRAGYIDAVSTAQAAMTAGRIRQVNVCRLLSTDIASDAEPLGLAQLLTAQHPAPFAGVLDTGSDWAVCASPELYLTRNNSHVVSQPIKGTVPPGAPFPEKDVSENSLVTEHVHSEFETIAAQAVVSAHSQRAELPGLAHLYSTVTAQLHADQSWHDIFAATFPPASVAGVPRAAATAVISEIEPVPRGLYCGAIGYIDADNRTATLAAAIRTFYTTDSGARLHFGTGAGITPASQPSNEWDETELKARKLMALASTRKGHDQ